jgi:hypothetical protein
MAREMRSREKTVLALKPEDLGRHMAARFRNSTLAKHRADAPRAWLIEDQRLLLTKFVRELSNPHDDRLIEAEDVAPPSAESFRLAIRAVSDGPHRLVVLHLGSLVVFGNETWEKLPEALQAEGKDLMVMLGRDDLEVFSGPDPVDGEATSLLPHWTTCSSRRRLLPRCGRKVPSHPTKPWTWSKSLCT